MGKPSTTTAAAAPAQPASARAWFMLTLSVLAQSASAMLVNGVAFLIPSWRHELSFTLVQAGFLVAMPVAGTMCALIIWGAMTDRFGERFSLTAGLAGTAAGALGAALSSNVILMGALLFVAGAFAASTNSAGGRVVVGWFPPHRRGLAMGIRQMAQPLGVGIASLLLPAVAGVWAVSGALAALAVAAALMAMMCGIWVKNPPRKGSSHPLAAANPYRGSWFLWRIHGVSALLVVPQFTVWTFALVWLLTDQSLAPAAAGAIVAVAQIAGALGRIGVGAISDRVGSRLRPLRFVAVAACISMLALALSDWLTSPLSIALLIVASVITVADNGLAFTTVAEVAGPFWSGRALGTQNTAQFLVAAAVPPAIGACITLLGFPATFAIVGLFPALAVPLIPHASAEVVAKSRL